MADDSEPATDDSGADVGHNLEAERTTAPMSDFPAKNAAIGAVVLAVGLAVGYGVPLLAL
ncbi:DUF7550 family protein [Halostagnicola kamekurae]|uniref:Uncharacterized protein n=1 Tax=Halostagnicola kamekurae TaxID=619731 RepID=A0A1I6QX07_9EURY|nr:hypothetical protein [Halostagnicola kamekurae]SFS56920.1 hypothetical protein SAMN04488556_1655 [Halostagnicola kamekurae]